MDKKLLSDTADDGNTMRDELFEALSRESDRGLILVSASYLDEALERLLRARFLIEHKKSKSMIDPLFNTFGPLSTFSAKIKVSYAIDLIEKWVYRDFEILRKLRNEFAHSIGPAVFDSAEVVKLTEKLVGADHAVTAMERKKPETVKLPKKKAAKKGSKTDSKAIMERFRIIMTVAYIGGLLHFRTQYLGSDALLVDKLSILSDQQRSET
jgi:DNA-binding MltR family transcriptional regulator